MTSRTGHFSRQPAALRRLQPGAPIRGHQPERGGLPIHRRGGELVFPVGFGLFCLRRRTPVRRYAPSRRLAASEKAGSTIAVSRFTPHAFTLIELILVMAILTMMVSLSAPTLSHFFRGRSLDSEARRMLALMRNGQSRAASEGIPMDFWVDAAQGRFGLEAERSYETEDPKAVDLPLDSGLQVEVGSASAPTTPVASLAPGQNAATASVSKVALAHPTLPTIRFLPDGSISDSSPRSLSLKSREGASLLLAQSRNRLTYEIRTPEN